jgi:FtsH-binding integral membrane protein
LRNILRNTYSWLAFTLLILSITCFFLDISVFNSQYIIFYGLSLLGLLIGVTGWRLMKLKTEGSVTKTVREIGFYGNLVIVILFFPPIYTIWGTLIFGP